LEHILKNKKFSKLILIDTVDLKEKPSAANNAQADPSSSGGSIATTSATTTTDTTSFTSFTTFGAIGHSNNKTIFSRLKETPAGEFPRNQRYLGDRAVEAEEEPEVWVSWASSSEWEAGKMAAKEKSGK